MRAAIQAVATLCTVHNIMVFPAKLFPALPDDAAQAANNSASL